MKILDVVQGEQDWHDARRKYPRTASMAGAMMGVSTNTSRDELIQMLAIGSEKEISDYVQNVIFEKGHQVEKKSRPIAQSIVGRGLYPVTATDDDEYLLASYDGLTMAEDFAWECKQWNAEKANDVRSSIVPIEDYWQVVQQLCVGAEKCLYMVTDGTEENTACVVMTLSPGDRDSLFDGWAQLDEDVANYEHVEAAPEVIGKAPDTLPALRIEVTGMVTSSNLMEFRETALAVFQGINKDLQTDDDFANADKTVKWCGEVEKRLEATKDYALSQTATIDELFKAIDDIKEQARATRLDLSKIVKARKDAVRFEIVQAGKDAISAHVDGLNESLGKRYMPAIPVDFGGAVKGKRTIASQKNAVNVELARAKIEASGIASRIQMNLLSLRGLAADYTFLFSDTAMLVLKDNDDVVNVIKLRIAEHQAAEEKRIQAEREKIRLEEQQKLEEEKGRVEPEEKQQVVTSPYAVDHPPQDNEVQDNAEVVPVKSGPRATVSVRRVNLIEAIRQHLMNNTAITAIQAKQISEMISNGDIPYVTLTESKVA